MRKYSDPLPVGNPQSLQDLQQMVGQQLARQQTFAAKKNDMLNSLLIVGAADNKPPTWKATVKPSRQNLLQTISSPGPGILLDEGAESHEGFGAKPLVPWKPMQTGMTSPVKPPRKKGHRSRVLPSLHPHLQPGRGIVRSVDILRIDDNDDDISTFDEGNHSSYSQINSQLARDVTTAFEEMFAKRKAQQTTDETRTFRSRIRTPPQLVDDDHTSYKSKELFNDMMDEFSVSASSVGSSYKSLGSRSAALMGELQAGYRQELSSYSSVALFVQARYLQMKEHEAETGNLPTAYKACVMGDLAMTLTRALGRYQPIMEPILWELLNCVFDEFATVETRVPHEKLVDCLSSLPTYVDKYREASAALDDANTELGILQRGSSMRDVVKRFQTIRMAFDQSTAFTRDACFWLWKKYTSKWRKARVKARVMGQRHCFRMWKLFVEERHLKALEEFAADIDHKIAKVLLLQEVAPNSKLQKAKAVIPLNEKPSSMRKYLQKLSLYVTERTRPLKAAMDAAAGDVVPSTAHSTPKLGMRLGKEFSQLTIDSMAAHDIHGSSLEATRWHQLKIAANACQEKMTQTPDDWMMDVPEPAFSAEELVMRKERGGVFLALSTASTLGEQATNGGSDSAAGPKPVAIAQAPSQKFQLTPEMGQHIIAFIYESRMLDAIKDKSMLEFTRAMPFLEYVKELLNNRYRIRRLANKYFRGLLACCMKEGPQYRRLELFGQLCGLSLVQNMEQTYSPRRCTFFFSTLHIMFGDHIDSLVTALGTGMVGRQYVLDLMPQIFSAVEKYDSEIYNAIMFEIIDLPRVDRGGTDAEYQVSVDEALATMMEYSDVEIEERDAHKLKERRDQEAKDQQAARQRGRRSRDSTSH